MSSLLLIVPLICLIILNVPIGSAMQRWLKGCPALLALGQVILSIFPGAPWWSPEYGGPILLPGGVDSLSMLMLLSIGLVLLGASLIGVALIRDERGRHEFSALLIISLTGMNGIVLVKDIFSLYVFLEILSVISFILIAFRRERDALEGSFKYIVLSAVASVMMLTGIGIFFLVSGGTGFDLLARVIAANRDNFLVTFGILMFISGLLIKGGVVPFHGWLPDAYSSALAPVSILLAGIVTKVSGVYTLIRLVTEVFGFNPETNQILLFTGALSIVAGALAAMGQKDMKRMLAYSSVSQVGYIILSLGAGTTLGIAGAAFHLFNHAIFKSQLFMNAAAVEMQTGSRDLDRMGGLGAGMPITATTSVIAFLSAAGIPPLAGFWSKLVIVVALWKAGHAGYMTVAVLASLLTLAYFLILQRRLFFGRPQPGSESIREAGLLVTLPSVVFASIIVGIGLSIPFLYDTIILPIGRIL